MTIKATILYYNTTIIVLQTIMNIIIIVGSYGEALYRQQYLEHSKKFQVQLRNEKYLEKH